MNSEGTYSRDVGPLGDIANSIQQKGRIWVWPVIIIFLATFFFLSFIFFVHYNLEDNSAAGAAPLSSERVKGAAKAGLAAAATKAKLFADHEEREIQRLSANIINHQVQKFLCSFFIWYSSHFSQPLFTCIFSFCHFSALNLLRLWLVSC